MFPCGIIFAVSQFKPKTTSLGVSKLWSTIFLPSKLTEILEICQDSSLLKINKTVQMFNISVNFKDTKKVDHILKISSDFQSLFDALYVIYQLSEIKDDIQAVSQFPCLLGHPVVNQQNGILGVISNDRPLFVV